MNTRNSPKGRILIIGGATGMGKATAQTMLDRGHDVVLVSRRGETLAQAASSLKLHCDLHCGDRTVDTDIVDLADMESVRSFATRNAERLR
jgi:NAD(P)-dependent dehydrogenase (short-subunit alcohol dehydrogenase family)